MDIHGTYQQLRNYIVRHPRIAIVYAICGVLAFIPIFNVAYLILHYSVNVPWWDQMSFVDIMQKIHNGDLTVYDLWMQHNEHRILVPQVFEILTGAPTGYNFRVPVFFNLVTALGSFALLVALLRRTFASSRLLVAILAVPFAWLVFTPFQWVNWIWGFQLAFFMCIFFTLLSLWLLTGKTILSKWSTFAIVVVAAATTTYCNGNGMLVWVIGLLILLARHADRRRIYVWCASAVAVLATYFYTFKRPPDSPHITQLIHEPVAVCKYIATYLGRNITTTQTTAQWAGIVLCILVVSALVYLYRKQSLHAVMAWIGLAAYVFGTAALAAASRLNQGVQHSFNSNSAPTLSLLFIVAAIAILAYALRVYIGGFKAKRAGQYLVVCAVLGGVAVLPIPGFGENYVKGNVNFKDLGAHLLRVQDCIYTARNADDPCLDIVYPVRQDSWRHVQVLRDLHWGDFKSQ